MLSALEVFSPFIAGEVTTLYCDNQVIECAVRNGFSKAYYLRVLVEEIRELISDHSLALLVERVASDDNPSDGLTRADLIDTFFAIEEFARSQRVYPKNWTTHLMCKIDLVKQRLASN